MDAGAVSIAIDETRRLIRVVVTGSLTDALLTECSRTIRATPEFQNGYAALLDLASITEAKVSSQVVIGFGQGAQKDTNRFAILARNITAFGMARMYEMIADVTETRVWVFTDEELAMEWLTQ